MGRGMTWHDVSRASQSWHTWQSADKIVSCACCAAAWLSNCATQHPCCRTKSVCVASRPGSFENSVCRPVLEVRWCHGSARCCWLATHEEGSRSGTKDAQHMRVTAWSWVEIGTDDADAAVAMSRARRSRPCKRWPRTCKIAVSASLGTISTIPVPDEVSSRSPAAWEASRGWLLRAMCMEEWCWKQEVAGNTLPKSEPALYRCWKWYRMRSVQARVGRAHACWRQRDVNGLEQSTSQFTARHE